MSNSSHMSSRFTKIRELRESICNATHSEKSIASVREEFLAAMQELKVVVDDDKSSVEDIRLKVSEILSSLSCTNGNKNE